MDNELHINDEQFQYIARSSHGKDSLKMIDVIVKRGLRLDRITTTDIWATDTIRGEHPEMVKFKDIADEYIWRKYRIEVEHLCAMRNGEKITYEKMFYHVPKRKPSSGGGYCRQPGTILGWPTLWGPWCQSDLKVRGIADGFPSTKRAMVSEAQAYMGSQYQCREKANGAKSSKPGFWTAPPRGAVKISWSTSALRRTSLPALGN